MEVWKISKITVVDAPCGAGKTSWAIQQFRRNPDKQYIYVTPLLDEIKRIKHATEGIRKFEDPKYEDGRKIHGFNRLLANGDDIALTHSTFANSNDETLRLLKEAAPVLVMDETINILVDYNETQGKAHRLSGKYESNIKLLIDGGYIEVDEYGRVNWVSANSYPNSAFSEVERLARSGNLLWLDNHLLLWEFPPQIFQYFSEIYVLTYLFEGNYLKPFFDYHGLEYEKKSVVKHGSNYELCPYRADYEWRKKQKGLLHIENRLNHYRNSQLSSTGQDRLMCKGKETDLSKSLKNDLYNYFQNIRQAKAADILWTCKEVYKSQLKGKGYTSFQKEIADGGTGDVRKVTVECFLPLNARASNEYKERHILAYVYNMNSNPSYDKYFAKRTDVNGLPISIDNDLFAVGCLIQWIWRSAIRDGEEVWIYLPAPRMRNLLIRWLDGEL